MLRQLYHMNNRSSWREQIKTTFEMKKHFLCSILHIIYQCLDSSKNFLVSTSIYATGCLPNEIRKHIKNGVGENESVHGRKISDVKTEGEA